MVVCIPVTDANGISFPRTNATLLLLDTCAIRRNDECGALSWYWWLRNIKKGFFLFCFVSFTLLMALVA